MIDFGGFYYIAAERVVYITCESTSDKEWPYRVDVELIDEGRLALKFRNKEAAQKEKDRICAQIEAEKRRDAEQILNRLNLIEQAVKGLDRRQYKIWRQLGALVRVVPEEKN